MYEVLRSGTYCLRIGDIDAVVDDFARQAARARAAGDEPEDGIRAGVVARERFADTRGSAGDDDAERFAEPLSYLGNLPFLTMSTTDETASSMPCGVPPCSALMV